MSRNIFSSPKGNEMQEFSKQGHDHIVGVADKL
jgi:hypothetical protein